MDSRLTSALIAVAEDPVARSIWNADPRAALSAQGYATEELAELPGDIALHVRQQFEQFGRGATASAQARKVPFPAPQSKS